ncbi:MAG: ABC transporter ATP-binding protein [Lachnospiraceae bacterium]
MFSGLRKIYKFVGKNKSYIIKTAVFGVFEAFFHALQLGALLLLLQALVERQITSAIIWMTFGIMVVSILGKIIFGYKTQISRNTCGYQTGADKRIEIGDRIKYMPMGYFNENSMGNITTRLTTTMFDFENIVPLTIDKVLTGMVHALIITIWLFVCDYRIGCIALVGIILFALVNRMLQNKAAAVGPQRQQAQMHLSEAVLEFIQGMGVVKAFGMAAGAGKKIEKAVADSRDKNIQVEMTFVPMIALQQLVLRVFSVLMVLASIYFYLNGTLSLSYCLMFIVASFFMYSQLETAGSISSLMRSMEDSIARIRELEEVPLMDVEGKALTPADAGISCSGVDFSYEEKQILHNVNIEIPENTTTAIVGPSGSGKTTICHLISRFWDVDSGNIKVGGYDVRAYSLDSLLENISMVFQHVYLFNDTVENNIKFGNPQATHEQVEEAARKAQCHDFIEALPQGYDTVIGEAGDSISGGEKQRISIARALIKDAPIIILDEATANVDPENEERLQQAIEALTRNKTIIMIAHRLKTVRNARQIIVMDEGKIVQQGTHDELMQADGIYKKFVGGRKEAIGWKVVN